MNPLMIPVTRLDAMNVGAINLVFLRYNKENLMRRPRCRWREMSDADQKRRTGRPCIRKGIPELNDGLVPSMQHRQ